MRPRRLRTEQIAAEHEKIDVVDQGRLKDRLSGSPRCLDHRLAQRRRQQIEIPQRSLEMKVAGMNKTERLTWHRIPPCGRQTAMSRHFV